MTISCPPPSSLGHPTAGPRLRAYPRNSPEAAARLVALALIADGRIKAVGTATLDALRGHARLGLTRPGWHCAIQELCADLLGPAPIRNDIAAGRGLSPS